jgi:UPF0176 protein
MKIEPSPPVRELEAQGASEGYAADQASPILNVAGYRFVALDDLSALRDRLHRVCVAHGIRGTILLAPEGINLFVAGFVPAVAALVETLDGDPRLANLALKRSVSARIPFKRIKVKVKREIIAFGVCGIDPAIDPAPAVEAETLKEWLDRRSKVLLLDTRNRFEWEQGTFEGALHLGNDSFRDFASLAQATATLDRDVPIVTFCTGGIRCEKAAPLLRRLGYTNVYQLAGGILRYFERVGSAHYVGNCFVFDERVMLDADLETRASQKPVQL